MCELVATGDQMPVRVKMFAPRGRKISQTPAVVRLHGGGIAMGSLEKEERSPRALANRAGARVLAPGIPTRS